MASPKADTLQFTPSGTSVPPSLFVTLGDVPVVDDEMEFAFGGELQTGIMFSAYAYDMSNTSARVQVTDHGLKGTGHISVEFSSNQGLGNDFMFGMSWHPALGKFGMRVQEGEKFSSFVAGAVLAEPHMRIRHTNGALFFEASDSGSTWTVLWQTMVDTPPTDMYLTISADTDYGTYGYQMYGENLYGTWDGAIPEGKLWLKTIGGGGRLIIAERILFDSIYEEQGDA